MKVRFPETPVKSENHFKCAPGIKAYPGKINLFVVKHAALVYAKSLLFKYTWGDKFWHVLRYKQERR